MPPNETHPDPLAYQAERRQLQRQYISRLEKENHLRHNAASDAELQNLVLRLPDELAELRRRAERHQRVLMRAVALIIALLLVVGVGGWWAHKHLHTGIEQVRRVDAEKIRAHLRQTIEETHRRELAEADKAADWKQRHRLREGAEAAHAARLGRIEELVASFVQIEGRTGRTSVFQEMTRILAEQGVDEAIAYVTGQQAAILRTVRDRAAAGREKNRAELQPLLKAAGLRENKGQSAEARALYREILGAEPDWPLAQHEFLRFLTSQGDDARIHSTLACQSSATQTREASEEGSNFRLSGALRRSTARGRLLSSEVCSWVVFMVFFLC